MSENGRRSQLFGKRRTTGVVVLFVVQLSRTDVHLKWTLARTFAVRLFHSVTVETQAIGLCDG